MIVQGAMVDDFVQKIHGVKRRFYIGYMGSQIFEKKQIGTGTHNSDMSHSMPYGFCMIIKGGLIDNSNK